MIPGRGKETEAPVVSAGFSSYNEMDRKAIYTLQNDPAEVV